MVDLSDKELLELFIGGNNESLNIIYNKYRRQFKKVSEMYIYNLNDSEDIVQNVFLKLIEMSFHKRQHFFSQIDLLPAFFNKIIKNACLDFNKKKRIYFTTLESNQYSEIIDEKQNECLEIDFNSVGLSNNEKLFLEEYLKNQKPMQIGLKYKKSVSTIKNTLNNAKKKIIKHYKLSV